MVASTTFLNKIRKAIDDPLFTAYYIRSKIDRHRLFTRYAELSRKAGLKELYLVLSFDCDTADDISVVSDMHKRLVDMGVRSVYAVPGELLKKGEKNYRQICETGGEFINHGYREHTYFDISHNRHASCFFYDQQSFEAVRKDIVMGDSCLKEILGITPHGFRTPHFGTFQESSQLKFLHSVLSGLGYDFSTSTTPFYAFRFGPIFKKFGLFEIPVSGMGESPLTILDTWGCFTAPNRTKTPEDYYSEGVAAADAFGKAGIGVLNYYADPSHIYNKEIFFKTVKYWTSISKPANYMDLLK